MNLLTPAHANAKTAKNAKIDGYLSYILHLSPERSSGYNTCKFASAGCATACLNTAGRGRFDNVQTARKRKTIMFFEQRQLFWQLLIKDLIAVERKATKLQKRGVVRLNGTSDLPWHALIVPGTGKTIFALFPGIQFYDYTKDLSRLQKLAVAPIANYHVTFSRSETNSADCHAALALGFNVAVVFAFKPPKVWAGFGTVSGDDTDLRFLDAPNSVVYLTAKGKAKRDASGFVIKTRVRACAA